MTEVIVRLPSTGFVEPDTKQLASLRKIVSATHPTWTVPEPDEFRRAFVAQGFFFRLAAPCTTRYYASILDDANEFLTRNLRWQGISGGAFLFAIRAANDVPIRFANRAVGQLQEVGLDPFTGLPCRNKWRGLLAGENLIEPTPPPRLLREQAEPSPVTVFKQNRPGQPWVDATGSNDPLWR
jgi:hypothetical protein